MARVATVPTNNEASGSGPGLAQFSMCWPGFFRWFDSWHHKLFMDNYCLTVEVHQDIIVDTMPTDRISRKQMIEFQDSRCVDSIDS